MGESEAGAAPDAAEPVTPRRRGPGRRKAAETPEPEATEATGEVIQQARFVISVRWLDTERTSLDLAQADVKRFRPRMSWHPEGLLLEADGQPTFIVPRSNLAWVRLA